ncbi:hypothetical protein ACFOY4_01535 [Actinomadura syzygii]|uniref:Uncharacterized protein n=1 Tax=Actinomadura syzygii TaxID=1427538 RepID=A0A5D0TTA8_9ACTN|nr:hypothetical protein [Actinomadura syzygii]TYC08572.1 hypothetical protein FXF65_37390 [Actinomadura syzygii]
MAFGRLTSKDLTVFDQRAKELILDAIAQGCTGRISSRGHCILRNNSNETASVPPNMSSRNRSSQNVSAQVRRLLAAHRPARNDASASTVAAGRPERITVARAFADHGVAFSSWLDERACDLPADAVIDVRLDETGQTVFEYTAAPPETLEIAPMNSTARADAELPRTEDSATLRRIREALGEDPRIAELSTRVEGLQAELDREKRRADEAEARIALLKEALGV